MKMEDLPKYTRVCGPIRELLGLKSTEEFTVILWTSPEEVPEEGSFLLLKLLDADGSSIICEGGAYENGRYLNYGWDGGPGPWTSGWYWDGAATPTTTGLLRSFAAVPRICSQPGAPWGRTAWQVWRHQGGARRGNCPRRRTLRAGKLCWHFN